MAHARILVLIAILTVAVPVLAACGGGGSRDTAPAQPSETTASVTPAASPSSNGSTTTLPPGVQSGIEAFVHDQGGVYIGECPGEWKPRGDTPEWCHTRESDQGQRFEVNVGVAGSDYIFHLVFEKDTSGNWQLISSEQAGNT